MADDVLDTTETIEQECGDGEVVDQEIHKVQDIVSVETEEGVNTVVQDSPVTTVTTDILQQAFVEASGGEITHIDDEQELCLSSPEADNNKAEQQPEELIEVQDGNGADIVDNNREQLIQDGVGEPSVAALENHQAIVVAVSDNNENGIAATNAAAVTAFTQAATVPIQSSSANNVVSLANLQVSATSNSVVTASPLGSKNNPIRIIQQGNTYKSTQKLSPDQIQQIVQVLQRQNLATKVANAGPTAVYNPETNTRIVYRVVQPHEKASNNANAADGSATLTARAYHRAKYGTMGGKRSRGRPRKRQRTQSDSTDSEEASDPPYDGESDSEGGDMSHLGNRELSPTEKLKKKREKPRTRSGRVSKPPTHMVKDYKQIHRVDWYEDYDDDDGGYSDIYDSDDERRAANQANESTKKKQYACTQCEKTYVGAKNLARHFRMTGHGDPAELFPERKDAPKADANAAGTENISESADVKNRGRPRKRPLEDDGGAWRPSTYHKAGEQDGQPEQDGRPGSGEGWKGLGRPPLTPWERKIRRVERLTNMLSSYSCAEVIQALSPRLLKDQFSLYDVMDAGMATTAGEQRASYTRMLQLYTELQTKMTELARDCLRPLVEGEQVDDDKEAIQIVSGVISHSIGIEPGLFEVSSLPSSASYPPSAAGSTNDLSSQQPSQQVNDELETPIEPMNTSAADPSQELPEQTEPIAPPCEQPSAVEAEKAAEVPAAADESGSKLSEETEMAAPADHTPVTTASAIAEAVSKLVPGDIITLDGQKIVIPEGVHIVQSPDGVAIYESKEPDAACIVNLKLTSDPQPT